MAGSGLQAGVDALQELGRLLGTVDARPTINRARLAPSTLHDPTYHLVVVCLAIRSHGEGTSHRILAAWLKLLQFVAARPGLVGNLREYVKTRREHDLESWSRMPRGYLGDQTHESVIDLLVAAGYLRRSGDNLEAGKRYAVLDSLALRIEAEGLFAGERSVLAQLHDMRVTKALLGGS